jgi:hypothetical protein
MNQKILLANYVTIVNKRFDSINSFISLDAGTIKYKDPLREYYKKGRYKSGS